MKTVNEWSLEFDLLYNNISSNKAPGLTKYEKSVFLTRAQEAVLLMLYNGRLKDSFEETEEVTRYLATLVRQDTLSPLASEDSPVPPICEDSYIFQLPADFLFRTYESCVLDCPCVCGSPKTIPVIPVTQDEFWRTRQDPFRKDNKRRALRLAFANHSESLSSLDEEDYSELVCPYNIASYTVRYICKPEPIILEDLNNTGLSINGQVNAKTCLLPEVLHQTILMEAVKAAKSVWA